MTYLSEHLSAGFMQPDRDPGLFRARVSSPDLNQGPSDLQSDAVSIELSRQRQNIILLLYTIYILSVLYCFNMCRREASLNFVLVEYVE